jgi:hypothetical protein
MPLLFTHNGRKMVVKTQYKTKSFLGFRPPFAHLLRHSFTSLFIEKYSQKLTFARL